jgi:hypothetical protein
MAVRLQLENGKIKKYNIWCDRNVTAEFGGYRITKCGKRGGLFYQGCDHIDCAIFAAECVAENQSERSLTILGMGLLCILGGIIFSESGLLNMGIIGALVGIVLWALCKWHYRNNKGKKELLEFKDNGTVNGIKAKKID